MPSFLVAVSSRIGYTICRGCCQVILLQGYGPFLDCRGILAVNDDCLFSPTMLYWPIHKSAGIFRFARFYHMSEQNFSKKYIWSVHNPYDCHYSRNYRPGAVE